MKIKSLWRRGPQQNTFDVAGKPHGCVAPGSTPGPLRPADCKPPRPPIMFIRKPPASQSSLGCPLPPHFFVAPALVGLPPPQAAASPRPPNPAHPQGFGAHQTVPASQPPRLRLHPPFARPRPPSPSYPSFALKTLQLEPQPAPFPGHPGEKTLRGLALPSPCWAGWSRFSNRPASSAAACNRAEIHKRVSYASTTASTLPMENLLKPRTIRVYFLLRQTHHQTESPAQAPLRPWWKRTHLHRNLPGRSAPKKGSRRNPAINLPEYKTAMLQCPCPAFLLGRTRKA